MVTLLIACFNLSNHNADHLDLFPILKKLDKEDSSRPKDFWVAQKQIESNKDIKKIMKKVAKGSAAAMQREA
jgi:hypothetical protein